jgi:hypothetical protein
MKTTKILVAFLALLLLTVSLHAKIGIIVNKDLYPSVSESIDGYIADLGAIEGKDVWLQTTYFDDQSSPDDLRDSLKEHHANDELEGAVFIGDLPMVYYWDDGAFGLTDFWWMDLNAEYSGSNYQFQGDITGDYELEIWVSRITASVLEDDFGITEAEIVNNYLARAHQRMVGDYQTDWSAAVLGESSSWGGIEDENREHFDDFYDRVDAYRHPNDTKENWINELEEGHEFGVIYEHSSATSHATEGGSTRLSDIIAADMDVRFVNSFACSNGKYNTANMGSTYALDDNGLWSVSSTRTGSFYPSTFSEFNDPLVEGKSVGEAFKDWQLYCIDRLSFSVNTDWNYGMVIAGVGNLKITPYPVVSIDSKQKKPSVPFKLQTINSRVYYQVPQVSENKKSHVKISLYTVNGILIETLVNELKIPGKHFVALKKGKQNVAQGLYVCNVEIDGVKKAVRIINK